MTDRDHDADGGCEIDQEASRDVQIGVGADVPRTRSDGGREVEADGGEELGECAVDTCTDPAVEILDVNAPRGSLDMPACSEHASSNNEADASGSGEHSNDDSASSTDVDVDVVEHA